MGDTQGFFLAIVAVCSGGTVLAAHPGPDGNLFAAIVPAPSEPARALPEVLEPGPAKPQTIERSSDGLFYLDGSVSGHPVRFLVDTGANLTLIAPGDAARAGLRSTGTIALATANGSARIGEARIEELDLAGRRFDAFKVGVASNGMPTSLLGQDVLSRLGAITFSAGSMTIHAGHMGPESDSRARQADRGLPSG